MHHHPGGRTLLHLSDLRQLLTVCILQKLPFLPAPSGTFSPISWTIYSWKQYAKDYVLPGASVSLAFAALVVAFLATYIIW